MELSRRDLNASSIIIGGAATLTDLASSPAVWVTGSPIAPQHTTLAAT
ncbi:MAG: hypothetical protein H7288_20170 [Kineosporiaceae bacterium]|nr:hypothetical protein [Aeromicrobium sp.]